MVTPRRVAVIRQVDEQALCLVTVGSRQRLGDLAPVAALAEETVQEGDSRARGADRECVQPRRGHGDHDR